MKTRSRWLRPLKCDYWPALIWYERGRHLAVSGPSADGSFRPIPAGALSPSNATSLQPPPLLAPSDPAVGQAFARVFHMLSRPAQALADLEVARGIQDFLQANPNLTEPREGTTRDELIAATL